MKSVSELSVHMNPGCHKDSRGFRLLSADIPNSPNILEVSTIKLYNKRIQP